MPLLKLSNGWELNIPPGVTATIDGRSLDLTDPKPTIGGGPKQPGGDLPPGAYLVTPKNGGEPYYQGWKFLERGDVVGKDADGRPIDAQGRPCGGIETGSELQSMVTGGSLQWNNLSFDNYGNPRKGVVATGNPGGAVLPHYSVSAGGSFDLPFPGRLGLAKFFLHVPAAPFDLTFMVPGDEQDSNKGGFISLVSQPAPDVFGGTFSVIDAADGTVIVPEQVVAGSFYFPYRVGHNGGDGVPNLRRQRPYKIRVTAPNGPVWLVDIARPSRY